MRNARIDGSRLVAREAAPTRVHIGRSAHRALSAGRGSVLAAFASALYIESAAGIACLVPPWAPCGPLNVNLHRFEPGTWDLRGAAWQTRGATLAVDGLGTFTISPHDDWIPSRLLSACPTTILAGLASVQTALAAREIRGEVLVHALGSLVEPPTAQVPATRSQTGSIEAHFARTVPALSRWLHDALSGRGGASPRPVADLLGSGRGLTPSGDDCIVGVLVALHAFGEHSVGATVARIVCRHAPHRTTRLSAAHLDAACAGEAIEPVHAAIESIAANASPGPALDVLERYGHGSGFDALGGVLLAAGAIAQNSVSAPHLRRSRRDGRDGRDGIRTPAHRQ